ncbi:NIPSNAP family protein [Kitasatospora putterlickiae]|uniref:NIPSNAP family protein n=1 Tax=Kitasatospora putterlickiae TaxID=221725 RepID=A0ABN1XUW4_9ACTN
MIYELREYTAVPGRMPDLIRRFNEHAVKLLGEHGMEVVFISLTEFGPQTMGQVVYMLRHDSYDALERNWASFFADPRWIEARRLSELNGSLVSRLDRRLLTPTPFG